MWHITKQKTDFTYTYFQLVPFGYTRLDCFRVAHFAHEIIKKYIHKKFNFSLELFKSCVQPK